MAWFKSKKEKEEIRYQDERDLDYEMRREEAEEARREEEENRAEREEYISELESELTGEDTAIVTIHLLDDENGCANRLLSTSCSSTVISVSKMMCAVRDTHCTTTLPS